MIFQAGVGLGASLAEDLPRTKTSFVVEGRVEAVSRLPNPADSPYKDCLFTVKFYPHIRSSQAMPIMLALQGFTNRVLTTSAAIKSGDRLRVMAQHFDNMPNEYREQQLVDDFGEVDLPLWAAESVSVVSSFSEPLATLPWEQSQDTHSSIRVATPLDSESIARSRDIRRDLQDIQTLVDAHGGWKSWYDELANTRNELAARLKATPEGYLREGDNFVLSKVNASLGYVLKDDDPWYRDLINALVGMRDQFAKAGTDLIVLPIPMRDHVYATKFVRTPVRDGVLQPYWLKFQYDLLRRDIEVMDLVQPYVQALDSKPFIYPAPLRDGHPGPDGADLAAQAIAQRLKRYRFRSSPPSYILKPDFFRLTPSGEAFFPGPTSIPYVQVLEADGQPIRKNDLAEVLLIGDSMVTAPQAASNGSIGALAAYRAGVSMLYFKRAGSAPRLMYHLSMVQDPEMFSGRRVCIFVFSSSYLADPERPWRCEPFMDYARLRTTSAFADIKEWNAASPFAWVRGRQGLEDFFSIQDTKKAAYSGSNGLSWSGENSSAFSLVFPAWIFAAKGKTFIRLELATAKEALWSVYEDGKSHDLRLPEGLGQVTFSFSPGGSGRREIRIPASTDAVTLYSLEIRHEGDAEPLGQERRWKRLAHYNESKDFLWLKPQVPFQRVEGDLLRLDCSSAMQIIHLPSRYKSAGAYPDRMTLRMDAEEPTTCRMVCDGALVGLATLLPYPTEVEVALPHGENIQLQFSKGSPGVRIYEISTFVQRKMPPPKPE